MDFTTASALAHDRRQTLLRDAALVRRGRLARRRRLTPAPRDRSRVDTR